MGAASVSILRPWAATEARSAFKAAGRIGLPVALLHEALAGLTLGLHGRHGSLGLAAPIGVLDGAVYLRNPVVKVGDDMILTFQLGREGCVPRLDR
jgi:hypothetical protein